MAQNLDISLIKKIQTAVGTTADGIIGPKTLKAVASKVGATVSSVEKSTIKSIQTKVGATADGIIGPKTLNAIAQKLGLLSQPTQNSSCATIKWPSQSSVRSGKSIFGKVGDESNLVNIKPPYTLYYEGKALSTIRVHKAVADTVQTILKEVLEYYGAEKIHQLGLDQYSGAYNYRKTTSGTKYSMHAWGVAIDWDAENNTYSMHKPKARLSKDECKKWWEIWEKHGALSLGRKSDYDWMHVQFTSDFS